MIVAAGFGVLCRVELLVAAFIDAFILPARRDKGFLHLRRLGSFLHLLLFLEFFVEVRNGLGSGSAAVLLGSLDSGLGVVDRLRFPELSFPALDVGVFSFLAADQRLKLVPVEALSLSVYASLLQQSQPFFVSWNIGFPGWYTQHPSSFSSSV